MERVYKIVIGEGQSVGVYDADGGYTEFNGNTALGEACDFVNQTEADS